MRPDDSEMRSPAGWVCRSPCPEATCCRSLQGGHARTRRQGHQLKCCVTGLCLARGRPRRQAVAASARATVSARAGRVAHAERSCAGPEGPARA
eukprot:14059709-Alexandrium_andersonii.AAC.1